MSCNAFIATRYNPGWVIDIAKKKAVWKHGPVYAIACMKKNVLVC